MLTADEFLFKTPEPPKRKEPETWAQKFERRKEIFALHAQGLNSVQIAALVGVTSSRVRQIRRGYKRAA